MELSVLKKEYSVFQKKYALPEFSKLNQHFEIEKLDKESEILMRAIRKTMMDKIVSSLGFFDMLLNPVNIPRLYLPFIKVMNGEDKKLVDGLYDSFAELSLACMELELDYNEQKEAEMIKKIYDTWEKSRRDFMKLAERVHKPGNDSVKKEKSYFG